MNLISQILAKWRIIFVIVFSIKILLWLFFPPSGDLLNWVYNAKFVLESLSAGKLPSVSVLGAYGGMSIALAPFYWLYAILPIQPSALWLARMMRIPIFASDLITGLLIYRLVGRLTKSPQRSKAGFLSWYANPFNVVWLYLYGSFDVIPAAIVVLTVILARDRKWFPCGLGTSLASLLRIFPVVTVPFFFPQAKTQGLRKYCIMLAGFLLPLVVSIVTVYIATGATLATVANVPLRESWLLDHLGPNILGGGFARLTPVLLAIQFFFVLRYWKTPASLVHLTTVSIVALLLGAGIYGGNQWHFIWVSPLLSVCLALHPDELWIFLLIFATDIRCDYCYYLSGFTAGLWGLLGSLRSTTILDPTFAGAFYAFKATYLVKLNLESIHRSE